LGLVAITNGGDQGTKTSRTPTYAAESGGASVPISVERTRERYTANGDRFAAVSGVGQIERIAQVSYDAGERGISDLLDAYRLASSSRVRQALLELSVTEAEIELEFASGWEIR